MKRTLPLLTLAFAALVLMTTTMATAGHPRHAELNANRQARRMTWHTEYQHTASGYPVPLVVPPQANSSAEWSWGVAQSSVRPIYPQFRRPFGTSGGVEVLEYQGTGFYGTPLWPSHTRQFGVAPVRSPW
ncbi:MAG: hypothetical protein ACKPEY_14185 [Planctomycetota bacterium]